METFSLSTLVVFLAEIGDKTQLLSLMLALRFRTPWLISLAILLANIPVVFSGTGLTIVKNTGPVLNKMMACIRWQLTPGRVLWRMRCIGTRCSGVYGGPCRSPRNNQLRTPPGPEGSNGSSDIMCRGVAGRVCLHFFGFSVFSFPNSFPCKVQTLQDRAIPGLLG